MTKDEVKQLVVNGANRLLSRARLLGIDSQSAAVIQAQRDLFTTDPDALDRLYRLLPANLRLTPCFERNHTMQPMTALSPDQVKLAIESFAHVLQIAGTMLGRPGLVAAATALSALVDSDQWPTIFGSVASLGALWQALLLWLQGQHPAAAAYLEACGD